MSDHTEQNHHDGQSRSGGQQPVQASGSCLCNAVKYTAAVPLEAGACHCSMCRKWAGGPLMAVHALGDVKFIGEESIQRFRSSEWAERGFCKNCGSNLFYYVRPREGLPEGQYIFPTGTVDSPASFNFAQELFVDHAEDWYAFTSDSSRQELTEAEVFAMYGASPD